MTTITKGNRQAGAVFSPCERYRYRLWRRWGEGKMILWIMLNPSTADENVLDPTVTRCQNYAKAWGFAGFEVCNLFAIRATDPKVMLTDPEPVGPENDGAILTTAHEVNAIMAAWGNHGAHHGRSAIVTESLHRAGHSPQCLRLTQTGEPSHPLYLPGHLTPIPFPGGRP